MTNSAAMNKALIHGYILAHLNIPFGEYENGETIGIPSTVWNVVLAFSECMLMTCTACIPDDYPVPVVGAFGSEAAYVDAFKAWDTVDAELMTAWREAIIRVNEAPKN